MQDWQQRVVAEKADLDNKIEKLTAFVGSERWGLASSREKALLSQQKMVMENYSRILGERIELWRT